MITALFLIPILSIVLGLVSLLPSTGSAALPIFLTASVSSVSGYFGALYEVIPVTMFTLISIIGVWLALEAAIFAWKGLNWTLRRFPTQS